MRKKAFWLLAGLLFLSAGLASAQALRSGEAAIFMMNGERVIGRIVDISSARAVLQLESKQEIPLSRIWMINFIDGRWDFPDERNRIESAGHYVFLRDGGLTSGLIRDFSSRQFVFELDNGQKIEVGRIRRIYFARRVPDELLPHAGKPIPKQEVDKFYHGPFRSAGLMRPARGLEVICERGWYGPESDPNAPLKQWHWTSHEAWCVIVNPRRQAQLVIVGMASQDFVRDQRVTILVNGQKIDEFFPGPKIFQKTYMLDSSLLGDLDQFQMTILVDPAFIPRRILPRNMDDRELGVQIASIFVR